MRPWIDWLVRVGVAGAWVMAVGCGGGDVPDPGSDSTAASDAAPDGANLLELVRGFGFSELGRFETAYRAAFSETPLTTLQRAPGVRFINP